MIAIYCRKSIYSDTSDSVQNQEQMCKDFIRIRNQDEPTTTYTDEGFTGANTDRPNLNRLIRDIKAEKIDTLVVYQLDRLSRSVRDFAVIFDLLEHHKVAFLSVKENIDTSSPIGKAMIYITMVFAQMERETIAQRVTDNMQGLAKKGYWTGGKPPVGYTREKIATDGKHHTTIVPADPDYVRQIYSDFLKNHYSLTSMETAYKKQGIKTRSGAFFSTAQLHKILTCPFYVEATPEVYNFFTLKGCQMADECKNWSPDHGVMVYGRTTERNKKHEICPPSEWIVCCGQHEPIIDAETWLNAQEQLKTNVFNRVSKFPPPMLKGVLRCKKCGCLMQVSRKHYGDKMVSYYYCITRSRKGTCTMSQIRTDKLDQLVIDAFKEISLDDAMIEKYLPKQTQQFESPEKIKKQIAQAEKKINNLVAALANTEPNAQKRLISALDDLDKEVYTLNEKLRKSLDSAHSVAEYEQINKQKAHAIKDIIKSLDYLSPETLNRFAKSVITECTFDGSELFLRL